MCTCVQACGCIKSKYTCVYMSAYMSILECPKNIRILKESALMVIKSSFKTQYTW